MSLKENESIFNNEPVEPTGVEPTWPAGENLGYSLDFRKFPPEEEGEPRPFFEKPFEENVPLIIPDIPTFIPKKRSKLLNNPVDHPAHYTTHPSGIEAITICEHMSFCLGNVMKYVWRADLKNNAIEDLEKALWYLKRELYKRTKKVY
jgi:hypothetical protein